MATKTPTLTWLPDSGTKRGALYQWRLDNGDVGAVIDAMETRDHLVQVEGDFGVGGKVVIEGSIDGEHYHPMTDHFGGAVAFDDAGMKRTTEVVRHLRPACVAGDNTTALVVSLVGRKV